MVRNMINWKKILLEAVLGFTLWTLLLTPYMIFVVRTSLEQYMLWLGMQACLIPPLAPLVFKITKYLEKKRFREKHV